MIYYHGETECPYEANSRESVCWGDEMEYVADCEARAVRRSGCGKGRTSPTFKTGKSSGLPDGYRF